MPLPVVCTQLLFHSSLYVFQHYAAITHLPNRAEHDKSLNGASPKHEKLCQEQRLCLDRQGNAQAEKRVIYLTLEEEGRFSSGYGCLSKGHWGGEQGKWGMRITRWPLQRPLRQRGAQREGARCTGNSANKTYGVCSIPVGKSWSQQTVAWWACALKQLLADPNQPTMRD